jgi:hypothetical protein
LWVAQPVAAQTAPVSQVATAPVAGTPDSAPDSAAEDKPKIQLSLPRPIQAVSAAVGLGRPRLALVLAVQSVGRQTVLATAARDAAAVAQTLRSSGYLVMLRTDPSARELRDTLREFRERLQPGTAGFVYLTAPGLPVDGANAVLPSDANVTPESAAGAFRSAVQAAGVPLSEVIDALAGAPDSPRLLVADAAFAQPGWPQWPAGGLGEPRPPRGMMVLLAQAPGVQQVPEQALPLPQPPPAAARDVAASRFARALVDALQTPRLSGPAVLRATRKAIIEQSSGQATPWLGGDSDEREDFVDPAILDSLVPKTPEDMAREFARQSLRVLDGGGAATPATKLTSAASEAAGAASEPAAGASRPSAPGLAPLVAAVGAAAVGAGSVALAVGTTTAAAAVTGASSAVAEVGALALPAMSKALSAAAPAVARNPVVAPSAAPAAAPSANLGKAAALAATAAALDDKGRSTAPQARTVRAPDGGERPSHVPRRNAYGYAEGDTYTYRVIDLWKDEVHADIVTGVDQVLDDGRLMGNDHRVVMDPQGRPQSQVAPDGTLSRYEPCQALWWSKPKRGEDRPVRFTETFERPDGLKGEIEWVGSASVGRVRKIEVGSATFQAVPIESSGWNYQLRSDGSRSSVRWSRTVWYAVDLGHPVAFDIEDHDINGRRVAQERIELVHAQTTRTP